MGKRGPKFKYDTEEALQSAGDAYFEKCDADNEPYTICGLALALGVNRSTLLRYSERPEKKIRNTIKNLKARCEEYAEKHLYKSGQVAGVIFSLKNNYGWKDKIEHGVDPNDLAAAAEIIFNPVKPGEKD